MNFFQNFYIRKEILPTKFEVGSLETFPDKCHKTEMRLNISQQGNIFQICPV